MEIEEKYEDLSCLMLKKRHLSKVIDFYYREDIFDILSSDRILEFIPDKKIDEIRTNLKEMVLKEINEKLNIVNSEISKFNIIKTDENDFVSKTLPISCKQFIGNALKNLKHLLWKNNSNKPVNF